MLKDWRAEETSVFVYKIFKQASDNIGHMATFFFAYMMQAAFISNCV